MYIYSFSDVNHVHQVGALERSLNDAARISRNPSLRFFQDLDFSILLD